MSQLIFIKINFSQEIRLHMSIICYRSRRLIRDSVKKKPSILRLWKGNIWFKFIFHSTLILRNHIFSCSWGYLEWMCFKLPGFTKLKIIWHNVIILVHFVKSTSYTLNPNLAIPHAKRILCLPWSARLFYLMCFQVLIKFSSQKFFPWLLLLFEFWCYYFHLFYLHAITKEVTKGYITIIGWCALGKWKKKLTKHCWIDSVIGNTLFTVSTIARELAWIRID